MAVRSVSSVLWRLPANRAGRALQADAASRGYSNAVISTDPPYYDNIGYSDLSDFFYVWLRRSLCKIHPHLLSTVLVPKEEELVANPYRHGGKEGAREFFEHGFEDVFARAPGREPGLPRHRLLRLQAVRDLEGGPHLHRLGHHPQRHYPLRVGHYRHLAHAL